MNGEDLPAQGSAQLLGEGMLAIQPHRLEANGNMQIGIQQLHGAPPGFFISIAKSLPNVHKNTGCIFEKIMYNITVRNCTLFYRLGSEA
jgi:hypothetical protein